MTEKLYMEDCYQRSFQANVEEVRDDGIVLDTTAFYPTGGGQPADQGSLATDTTTTEVTDVQERDGAVVHIVGSTDGFEQGQKVEGDVDWDRRYLLMRLHTAQHLLSAVVLDEFGAETVGNQIHVGEARMDFEPADFSDEDLQRIQNICNSYIDEDRDVTIGQMPRSEVEERIAVGRSNLDLIPDHIDPLRVVEIDGLDICPCGGTHVGGLDEIGHMEITDRSSKGADTDRIRFTIDDA
jgi:misacylated tRNA(Ala) deacylase